MRVSLLKIIACFILVIAGCSPPRIYTAWQKHSQPANYIQILSACIIKDKDDSIRTSLERNMCTDLEKLGYKTSSLIRDFGPNGLRDLGQEETYLKLCTQGIDAVFLITLIDKSKEKQFISKKTYVFPERYYYKRIWNYKNIQADFTTENQTGGAGYFWEAILFNLSTLETECVIQSATFYSLNENNAVDFEKMCIQKMIKGRILSKNSVPKAF